MRDPDDQPMVLMVVVHAGPSLPTLSLAAAQLKVGLEAVDRTYGLVPMDLQRGLYTVRVRADALGSDREANPDDRGPFSDPRIEPM